ncbi:MAG: FAD-binding protein [Proteobacteria bacterium]|nr:FAD-binding protein [Pseudomonadota bacterium]
MLLQKRTINKLSKIVGKHYLSCSKEDLLCYSYDATGRIFMPDAVAFPGSADEISRIMMLACEDGFPVVPRGAGTGMAGSSLPVQGGVVLAMSRLNRIIDIDAENFTITTEPGVVTGDLHKAVEQKGLFYPPDPSSAEISTIGGNLAQCAGGPRAVKYGVTRDYVLGLEAILPTGEMIKTGVRTAKGVVGYDLSRLIVGSEGTLAIITKVILRLLPLPETVKTMTAVFDSMEKAAQAVASIMRSSIIPRTVEYMDGASIKCVESYTPTGFPPNAQAALIIELDGGKDETEKKAGQLKNILTSCGAADVKVADTEAEVKAIWKARKAISPALYTYGPDKINEDIVVPRNNIPDMVRRLKALGEETGLTIVSFGHAGDGNIHVNIMLDRSDERTSELAMKTVDDIFDYTLLLGGTLSGEHGVGITKKHYIKKEIGPVELALMKKIKSVFDPKNILNPGKLF